LNYKKYWIDTKPNNTKLNLGGLTLKVSVIGAGKSGLAAAHLAKRKGLDVFLSNFSGFEKNQEAYKFLIEKDIECEFGSHSIEKILQADIVVVSPGILPSSPIMEALTAKNAHIESEVEFAYRYIPKGVRICAVTGTNGKTTTATLLHYIFQQNVENSYLAGNVGLPISDIADKLKPNDILTLELSSFQLDRIHSFCPDVAVILNITPDHLYYHGSFQQYSLAKWKITQNQNHKNLLILNGDYGEFPKSISETFYGERTEAQISLFSINQVAEKPHPNWGIWLDEMRNIRYFDNSINEEIILMTADSLSLCGAHNLYNSMAAVLAARRFEITKEDIRDALCSFAGVEHRLETVRTLTGVTYINDSKATNINSAWYALSSYNKPIIWIAGGRGEDNDYSSLDEFVKSNVKEIIAIGEEKDNLFNHFSALVRVERADSLKQAVHIAASKSAIGDIVLFSPACKSFDMFANFEHRGDVYKQIVNQL